MSTRGFPVAEYKARLVKAQAYMAERELAGLLLTTEPEVRYFTGYLTRFWESPTRPWFLVIPASGDPIAVIPTIGAALMGSTWIEDIRTWAAPDLGDDGVSLLAETLGALRGRIGVPAGHETHVRMPLSDLRRLEGMLGTKLVEDGGIMRHLRMIKSGAEIAKIRRSVGIADRAFARVPEIARAGTPLVEVFRRFQILCLEEGADWVPYLAGGAGPEGYADVISPASTVPLAAGDVLMVDTGVVWDGYFCDFDRNFAVGPASASAAAAHARLIEATEAGLGAARPGATVAEVFSVMDSVLGMQLTEWPSLMAGDETVIAPGMVLTLEPGIATSCGRMMAHEENIVITKSGAEWLSTPLGPEMAVLESPG